MRVLLWGKIRFVNIPTELFFIPFPFEFKVKMHRDEDFLCINWSFLFDVDNIGSKNELFIDSFVESSVPGSS